VYQDESVWFKRIKWSSKNLSLFLEMLVGIQYEDIFGWLLESTKKNSFFVDYLRISFHKDVYLTPNIFTEAQAYSRAKETIF